MQTLDAAVGDTAIVEYIISKNLE